MSEPAKPHIIKVLREALEWMEETIADCKENNASTVLPRGYQETPRKVRYLLKRLSEP